MTTVGELKVLLGLDDAKFQAGMKSAAADLQKYGQQMAAMGQKLTLGVTIPLGIAAAAAVKAASDAEEMGSKFSVVFGEMSGEATAWAEDFADSVDRSAYSVMGFMASFQDTFVPLGYAREEATQLSEQLTALTFDLSSFYNTSESEAATALSSALVGNHEAVRKFGIVLNEATINAELLAMGIEGGTRAASTQELVMARLNVIMNGTADAQGDLVRTSESFANQLRALQDDLKDLAVELGNELLPIMTDLIDELKGGVEWFSNLSESQKELIVKAGLVVIALGPVLMVLGNIMTVAAGATKAITGLSAALSAGGAASAGLTGLSATAATLGAIGAAGGAIIVAGLGIDKAIEGAINAGIIDGYKRSIEEIQAQNPIDVVMPVYAETEIIGMDVNMDDIQEQIDRETRAKDGIQAHIGLNPVLEFDGVIPEDGIWAKLFTGEEGWVADILAIIANLIAQIEQEKAELEIEAKLAEVDALFAQVDDIVADLSGQVIDLQIQLGGSLADLTIGLGRDLTSSGAEGFDISTQAGLGNLSDILTSALNPTMLSTLGLEQDTVDAILGEPLQTALEQLQTEQDIMQLAQAQAQVLADDYDLTDAMKSSLEGYLADVYGQAVGFEAQVIAAIGTVKTSIDALKLDVVVNVDPWNGTYSTPGYAAAGRPGNNGEVSDTQAHSLLEQQRTALGEIKDAIQESNNSVVSKNSDMIWKIALV